MLVNQVFKTFLLVLLCFYTMQNDYSDVVSKETLLLPIHPKLIITMSSLVKPEMKDVFMREKEMGRFEILCKRNLLLFILCKSSSMLILILSNISWSTIFYIRIYIYNLIRWPVGIWWGMISSLRIFISRRNNNWWTNLIPLHQTFKSHMKRKLCNNRASLFEWHQQRLRKKVFSTTKRFAIYWIIHCLKSSFHAHYLL